MQESKFKQDAFVCEMMAKHPPLKTLMDKLSFWQADSRSKLMGSWCSADLSNVELTITVEDNFFMLAIYHHKEDGELESSYHALLRGETDRLYYFIYKGKIVEMIIAGDMDEEGEDNGPAMYIDDYIFIHEEGTREFVQSTQRMADEDEVGMEAMKYLD